MLLNNQHPYPTVLAYRSTLFQNGFSLNDRVLQLQTKVPAIPSILKPKKRNASQQPEGKYGSKQINHVKLYQPVALLPPPTTSKQVYVED